MASRRLGDAFITIKPIADAFRVQAMALVKQALAGVNGQVPVTADTSRLNAQIALVRAKIRGLQDQASGVRLDANAKDMIAKIAAANAALAKLRSQASDLKIDADMKALDAKIAALEAQSVHLGEALGHMTADIDIYAAELKIAAIDAQVAFLKSTAENIRLNADTAALGKAIEAAVAKIRVLEKEAKDLPFNANMDKLNAQIDYENARLTELTKKRDALVEVKVDTSTLKKVLGLVGLGWAAGGGAGGKGGGGGAGAGAGAGAAAGAGAGAAAGAAGAFGLGFLNAAVGATNLWHVALSATLETIIAVGTAAAAAAIGIAAMAPAAKDIYTQLKAVDTVNEAMGSQIPSLSRQFDQLAKSLAPQVIEAYGGLMTVLNKNTGAFGQTARQVTTLVDDWVAKLDLWSKSQGDLSGILRTGVGYLTQFGSVIGHLGIAVFNLLKAAPGTAHFLLDMIDGFAKVLDWVSKLPAPLLEMGFAIHSAYIWGNVFSVILSKMPGLLGMLGRALTALGTGPLVVLAVLGTAAFELARAWGSSSTQVTGFIANINAALSSMTAGQAFYALPSAIGQLNAEMQKVNTSSIIQGWNSLNTVWQESGDKMKAFGQNLSGIVHGSVGSELLSFGRAIKDIFSPGFAAGEAASIQLKQDLANLNSEINTLLGSQRAMDQEVGVLTGKGYSFSQALALMSLAGVNVNDKFDLMQQKVDNLIHGYESMSVRGAILANSVDAITFASGLQASKVSDLNSAWDTFISTVTGGASGFLTFAQQVTGMYQAAGSAGVSLRDSSGRVSSSFGTLSSATANAKGSFTGLNSTSLALRQTFLQSVTDAGSYLDKLTTLAAAAGLGKRGTDLLAQGTKDMLALMLPAAKGSDTLTTALYALAQRGGYTGADSFQALSNWVGKTKQPMQDLSNITDIFTKAAGNLTTDVKNLSVALGTTLTGAMSQAIFLASGGQKAFNDFATAVFTSRGNVDKMKPSADILIAQLYKMTGNVGNAKTEFLSFAQGALHLTQQQADELWQSSLPALQRAIDSLHGKDVLLRVNVNGSGAVSANVQGGMASVQGANGRLVFGAAAGGQVYGPGGPTADKVPAMLSAGEYVINAKSARNIGYQALGKLNRFAIGGLVGSDNAASAYARAYDWEGAHGTTFAQADAAWFVKATVAAFQKAVAKTAAASAAAYVPGSSSYGGNILQEQQFAASLGQQLYGWVPAYEMPALISLWNQESGWNPYAVNPNGGAYGIPQSLGHGHPYNLGDWANQIRWGEAYIKSTYGDPLAAWAHEQANNWYSKGGPAGMASGGLAGRLRSQEALEARDYAKLASDYAISFRTMKPGSWLSGHRKSVTGELATLRKREQAESAAYHDISVRGFTKASLRHFATSARAEARTALDKGLVRGHPLDARALASALDSLNATAGMMAATAPVTPVTGPGGGGGRGGGGGHFSYANLRSQEALEARDYAKLASEAGYGLQHAKKGSRLSRNRALITGELATLRKRELAESAAYHNISVKGFTKASLTAFAASARAEARTALDKGLVTGYPAAARSLAAVLETLNTGAGALAAKGPKPPPAVSALARASAKLLAYDLSAMAPTSLSMPGSFGYSSGGVVNEPVIGWGTKTGASYRFAENGPETVTPGAGITPGERAILKELRAIRIASQQQGAQFGRVINGAMTRAASSGYYGG